jgi:hypothetical protein
MNPMQPDGTRREARFWKIVALCALCLSAWVAFSRSGSVQADNGGATAAGMIAIMGNNPASEHLYLIDTNSQMILMYESRNGNDFSLMQARGYQYDLFCANRAVNKEIAFAANGHAAKDICAAAEKYLKQQKP